MSRVALLVPRARAARRLRLDAHRGAHGHRDATTPARSPRATSASTATSGWYRSPGGYFVDFDPAWLLSGVTANGGPAQDQGVTCAPTDCPAVPNDNLVVDESDRVYVYFLPTDARGTVLTKHVDRLRRTRRSRPRSSRELVAGTSSLELFEPLSSGRLAERCTSTRSARSPSSTSRSSSNTGPASAWITTGRPIVVRGRVAVDDRRDGRHAAASPRAARRPATPAATSRRRGAGRPSRRARRHAASAAAGSGSPNMTTSGLSTESHTAQRGSGRRALVALARTRRAARGAASPWRASRVPRSARASRRARAGRRRSA